ncbi:type VI secretion system-associated FHA domain protein TagH (plasmid) [Paracoccus sp. TK19116]|uniref:Type VI secretion system-associated FHA domain protein TagH n=1 Tax=Paracoccus albicereus TaxID=2922394 RepID=A0ABT1MLK4_9RHOB|nr:type VI secretion system-associated FHA domain protein TagH [Paracoccus albicereus]MCQ0969179.1 type VI secretion system-associated FHA domain protein TagH [Paracoccus albicereus]
MSLVLQIENHQTMDDGGPSRIVVPQSGLSGGRSRAMDWVLPDASRHISGHHFDVYHDARGWWLRDVSTNGTFLQGQRYRMDGPHPLQDGDRFQVGQYLIVALFGQGGAASGGDGEAHRISSDSLPDRSHAPRVDDDPWAIGGGFEPVEPLPARPLRPMDDFASDFIPTGAPRPSPAAVQPAPQAGSSARETTGVKPPSQPTPDADFVRAFCKGVGLPPELYGDVDASALATALGRTMHSVVQQIMMALQDRAAAKQFARTGERTMRAATDNNPLKFLPDPAQAVEALFLKPRDGFMTAPDGLDEALRDLRLHQAALFAALQPALGALLSDLSPEGIEADADTRRLGGNRKAKAWELFVERWDAKAARHDNGMLDEFLDHFAAVYRDVEGRGDPGASRGGR